MKLSRIFLFIVLFTILIVLSGVAYVYDSGFLTYTRADAPNSISIDSSYVFITPPSTVADGNSRLRVTIFCLDTRGKGIRGLRGAVEAVPPITVIPIQENTDTYGKAVFDLTSAAPVTKNISIKCGVDSLSATSQVSFQ